MEKGWKVCCICNRGYYGYGNNSQPIKEGKCCDTCNDKFVIPNRRYNICVNRKKEKDSE